MHVLVVEDDRAMAALLAKALREEGDAVSVERDGPSALDVAGSHPFDAIVLDVMLPGLDGFAVARTLRARGVTTPILMLTARDADADIVRGLSLGADDYLTKPFALDVFFARLRAVARRGERPLALTLSLGDLEVHTGTRTVTRGGRRLRLTRTEYALLELLLRNAGLVISRQRIIDAVWGFDAEVEPNTLEAFVHSLRAKVDRDDWPRLIHTVRGVGYSLRRPEAEAP